MRTVCREQGYSLRRLAAELDASHEAVRAWQAGENYPHRRYRRDLQAIFCMPITELMAPETSDGDTPTKRAAA